MSIPIRIPANTKSASAREDAWSKTEDMLLLLYTVVAAAADNDDGDDADEEDGYYG